MNNQPKRTRTGWIIILVLLIGIGLEVALKHLPHSFQHHYGDLIRALIVLLDGGAISWLVERWLKNLSAERIGSRRATSLRFMARLVLYLAIALALLAAFGVGLSSVVFGSAFLTVILGLAGQSFFSNLIAGIGLVIFHPFEVGDRIAFVAWQYPLLMPSFAHDTTVPAYRGVVTDINLAYTTLMTDEGVPLQVPNGVLIQAAVHNYQRRQSQTVRLRFDLDLSLDPSQLIGKLQEALQALPMTVEVQLADVGPATFGLRVVAKARGGSEDAIRHQVLNALVPLVQQLRKAAPTKSQ
ncbi:mechanosensitive ion channel family protein [Sulfobacillus harzensis]|uniref:Mechanosensitive ion channel family protein n=1 Tax=Sulfobacillus harzensis TaxID=2729629 RepID=A0A7Y0L4B5_9FIRM|nr:mechanosensitive ion channel family protein [Sulfobacillus harzensis]NMP21639.1 mechanosensitive ion channel family protein [Sulfobacillus harzensis]